MSHPAPPDTAQAAAEPKRSPLHDRHVALGAAFTDFGGWQMPVRYASDLAEHHAVRQAAGLFDISHMAEFLVTGEHSGAFLDYALSGDHSGMRVGKAKYSLVLTENGGIIDDVIVYRIADDRYLVIANAGNRDAVADAFALRAARAPVAASFLAEPRIDRGVTSFAVIPGVSDTAQIEDVTDQFALVAVQGPAAQEIVTATSGIEGVSPALADLGYYAWAAGSFAGAPLFIARTGYTGEDGFELLVPHRAAGALWDALLVAGAPRGLVPAGLAARDTLRLEAGMPLYGHELSLQTTPAQAGLARSVAGGKPDFVGKRASQSTDADRRVLVGLMSEGRRAGRSGYTVINPAADDSPVVGEVTSGALSPTLGHPIALAFVDPAVSAPGTDLAIDVRGTLIPASVTTLPFYRRTT
ncbi:MAG: glycine cleavage system aminomethyltransferase T [Microbacterium sp. 67-17]|uniref:glycine cleavage system aminomethyltransferase GcvT n=1 Tax=Microbacterium sp. 67-17 TaxID=1895782 RepID=UPI000965C386|nr:glycine cleavage system aminomethyltransferase GcvT [Microbacterium sp. 67-17]OJW00568.1 MAG: glycine cleavage system aminomethyltransferase T [Microbacterium sp. 67-17]